MRVFGLGSCPGRTPLTPPSDKVQEQAGSECERRNASLWQLLKIKNIHKMTIFCLSSSSSLGRAAKCFKEEDIKFRCYGSTSKSSPGWMRTSTKNSCQMLFFFSFITTIMIIFPTAHKTSFFLYHQSVSLHQWQTSSPVKNLLGYFLFVLLLCDPSYVI